MRTTEHAHRWEVDGLAARVDTLEGRLDRSDRERFERQQKRLNAALFGFWIVWAAMIGGMVVLAVQN